jgi:hypothetical protein
MTLLALDHSNKAMLRFFLHHEHSSKVSTRERRGAGHSLTAPPAKRRRTPSHGAVTRPGDRHAPSDALSALPPLPTGSALSSAFHLSSLLQPAPQRREED